jgi:hypothetical protein
MADKFRYSFDLTKKLEEQLQQSMLASGQEAVTSSLGMMSADPPAKELQEAEQSKYDPYSFIQEYKDMLFSMFGGEEEYNKVVAQQDSRLPIEEDPLNKVTEPYLKIIDVPQQPPVQVEQLEPDTESTQQAIRKATEQTLGIMQIEEYLDSIKQEKAQQEPDQQGLMSKPYDEIRMRKINEPLGEGLVSPDAGMLRPRARPVTSIMDAVTNADVVTDGKVDMNKVENVILNTIGNNIYSAGILGAIKVEIGEGIKDESPYYSLIGARGTWDSTDKVLKTLPEDVQARLKADAKKGIRKGGEATSADRKMLGEAMFDEEYDGGKKYKGRGLIQLTHKYNYEEVGKRIGVDLVANPELVNSPKYAVPAAIAYMEMRGFFKLKPNQVTQNKLQRLVNPEASGDIKKKRWSYVKDYLDKNTGEASDLTTSLRPRARPKDDEFEVASN